MPHYRYTGLEPLTLAGAIIDHYNEDGDPVYTDITIHPHPDDDYDVIVVLDRVDDDTLNNNPRLHLYETP